MPKLPLTVPFLPPHLPYTIQLTATNLSLALQNYINSTIPIHGQKIHTHILKSGFDPNINVSVKLLILHLKCQNLDYAHKVFDELQLKTLSAYNYLIGGYLRKGLVENAMGLVRNLILDGEKPDGFTCSMVLKASTGSNALPYGNLGALVHTQMLRLGIEADDVLYTSLVDSYVKSGRVGYARRVFDMMNEVNVICSTSMITGYMNRGLVEEAEDVFSKTVKKDLVVFNAMIEGYSKSVDTALKALKVYIEMQRFCFVPNISTFASIIGACSVLARYDVGQQVQGQLMKREFVADVKMGSALIDMYCKCGKPEDGQKVFDHMSEKNVFSWTSLIDGYGKNGNPYAAIELFHRMQVCCTSIQPNYVTFLSALSACAHAGLVSEGHEIFKSMERDYSLRPRMEHYACMADLLGRAGNLSQAWEFVMNMPDKPNSDVWAALLSCSNIHGDVEMANLAANELFKLKSDGRPGAYMALSNTLAAAGKWDGVDDLREVMKFRGILKDSGRSWIEAESSS